MQDLKFKNSNRKIMRAETRVNDDGSVLEMIKLKNVHKTFGHLEVLKGIDLEVAKGEKLVIIGPSGSGKSTLIRCMNGLEEVTKGEVYIDGHLMTHKTRAALNRQYSSMVFQQFNLYPHLTVMENLTLAPIKLKKVPKEEAEELAMANLRRVGLEKKAFVYPTTLSGGQQQRIALARAIVTNPKVMLLDEPLSNLDPKLRETMRFEIKELQKKFNFTIIFVTHDQSEAMALSDRMMVMDMGNIVQIGTPTELYNRPVNRFVHKFLGQSTFTDVVIQDGKVYAKGDMAQPLPVALPENGKREMVMATRPNQIEMNHTDGYKTKVEKRIFLTNYTEYLVRVGDQLLQVQTPHRNAFAQGETCYLKFPGIMWYGREDEQAEAERNRRQLV